MFYANIILSGNVSDIYIQANSSFIGSITNISVKEIQVDVPRIDFTDDPTGHLLLEPQSTNLVPYSEDFNNSGWNKIAATITPNNGISPDGTQNSDLFVPNSSGGQVYEGLGSKPASAISYTTSLYVKPKGLNSLRIYLHGSSNANRGDATFNLSNQTVSFSNNGAFTSTSASILNVGNGWYRCILVTTSDTSTGLQLVIRYDGSTDNVSGLNLWGCQTEQNSYATSYIPTSGSTVTRNQEICNNSGTASDFNSEEGVLYAEIAALADDGINRRISISNGTTSNVVTIELYPVPNLIVVRLISNSVQQAFLVAGNINKKNYNKIAIKYKENDCALWVNGTEVSVDTSAASPVGLSELAFDNGGGGDKFYGKTKNLKVFKRALTDAELYLLTVTQYQSYQEMATALNYTL